MRDSLVSCRFSDLRDCISLKAKLEMTEIGLLFKFRLARAESLGKLESVNSVIRLYPRLTSVTHTGMSVSRSSWMALWESDKNIKDVRDLKTVGTEGKRL